MRSPPRTAKRPLLITHPKQPQRPTLIAGSSLQAHGASAPPCAGGPHTSADEIPAPLIPPAQMMRPSGNRAAAGKTREWRRSGCRAHAPVARSTVYTVDRTLRISSSPPSKITCPAALSLSSTSIATAPYIPPRDSSGRSTNAPAESVSTFEENTSIPSTCVSPPRTTRVPLTAQHACTERAVARAGMGSHRSVARSSLHTSLTT
jgi:hypothetical protein